MTYKSLFKKSGFYSLLESDFCTVIKNKECQYVLYRNDGIRCVSLNTFRDVTLDELQYLYNISWEENYDGDEYLYAETATKDQVISFIFDLYPLKEDIINDFDDIINFFGESVFLKTNQGIQELGILLQDERGKIRDVLLFNENSYKALLGNRSCYWGKDLQCDKVVIGFDPFNVYSFFLERKDQDFAYFIFPDKVSLKYLGLPFEDKGYDSYHFLCNAVEEWEEALRIILIFINASGIGNLLFNAYNNSCELVFIFGDEEDILPYMQIANNALKKLRSMYLREDQVIKSFFLKKKNVFGRQSVCLTFNRNVQEIDVLTNVLVQKYNLPFVFE